MFNGFRDAFAIRITAGAAGGGGYHYDILNAKLERIETCEYCFEDHELDLYVPPTAPAVTTFPAFLVQYADRDPLFPSMEAVRTKLASLAADHGPIRIFEIAAEYTPKFETRVTLTKRGEKKTVPAKAPKAKASNTNPKK